QKWGLAQAWPLLSGGLQEEPGAQEKTRTSTPFRALAPEASASTSSATWAKNPWGTIGDQQSQLSPHAPSRLCSPRVLLRQSSYRYIKRLKWRLLSTAAP